MRVQQCVIIQSTYVYLQFLNAGFVFCGIKSNRTRERNVLIEKSKEDHENDEKDGGTSRRCADDRIRNGICGM